MIIDIKDIFYRSEYKHKKFYFVNEAAELYLKRKVQNYICRYEIEIFKKRCINKIKDIKNMKELKIENSETWEISKSRKSRKYYSELSHFWVFDYGYESRSKTRKFPELYPLLQVLTVVATEDFKATTATTTKWTEAKTLWR